MIRAFPRGARFLGRAAALSVLLSTIGCGHREIERRLDQPSYYLDNALAFQPDRIWRLKLRWDPYLLDPKRAMIIKQVQLIVHGDRDRKRLEAEIAGRGGDDRYLRWLEDELFPFGNWEERDDARVSRLSDGIVVSLRTHALKEVPIQGRFVATPVWFPDTVVRAVTDGCHQLNWDVIPKDTTVGFETVLESRHENPTAEKWVPRGYESPTLDWKQWSVGQERSIAYRTLLTLKGNISRCPLPPGFDEQFHKLITGQAMGIDW